MLEIIGVIALVFIGGPILLGIFMALYSIYHAIRYGN